jgi:hypothetical protein
MATTEPSVSMSDARSPTSVPVATSSSSHTMCATNTALTQTSSASSKTMETKLLIPIMVATFFLAAILTSFLAYLLIRRRRRNRFQQPLDHSGMSQTHFIAGRWDSDSFSPVSPENISNEGAVFIGTAAHEVDNGRRPPMEVMGSTTWAKGESRKDLEIRPIRNTSQRNVSASG